MITLKRFLDSICITLEMVVKKLLLLARFLLNGKRENIVPIYKKNDRDKILKIMVQFPYFRFVVKF